MICGTYANVSEISHYKLAAVINLEGSSITRGQFIAHIFDFNDNTVAKINYGKVSNQTINQVLNTGSFKSSIHSMFYIRQKGLINDKPSNFFVLPLHSQQSLQEIYIGTNEATSNFTLKSDIISCITGKE